MRAKKIFLIFVAQNQITPATLVVRGDFLSAEKKSKYQTHVEPRLDEIEAWSRDGVSDKDIAHNLGIAYSTLRSYKNTHESLAHVLKQSKDYVDNVIVTNSYLKRITGYDVIEVKRTYSYKLGPDGKMHRVLTGEIEQTRHIPGDPRAQEFWLAHRQPEKWGALLKSGDDEENKGGVCLIPAVSEDGGGGE